MPAKKKATRRTGSASRKPAARDPLARLTWEDLNDWAGPAVVERGRGYHGRGKVHALGRTRDGALLAWVRGGARYATTVTMHGKQVESRCTCPYGPACKHAVAVILAYLEAIEQGESVPLVEAEDPRIELLDADVDGDELQDDWEDDEGDGEREVPAPFAAARGREFRGAEALRDYLGKRTKRELIEIVEGLARDRTEVRRDLLDRLTLDSGRTDEILRAARREIARLGEVDWDGGWPGPGAADLRRLDAHLEALIRGGAADAVLDLAPELIEAGSRRLEAEPEGDSHPALADCLKRVFEALEQSSLSPVEQLLRAIELTESDEYGLLEDGMGGFWERRRSRATWSELADRLGARLDALPVPSDHSDFGTLAARDALGDRTIAALEKAGRDPDVIALCEREAPRTGSYRRLVEHLMAARRWADAVRWCERGIAQEESRRPGSAAALRGHLVEATARAGDRLRAAAILADEFFADPGRESFEALCKAARQARAGEPVEAWARHYLETGRTPVPAGGKRKRPRKGDPDQAWPLPESGLPPRSRGRVPEAPMTRVLIRIAIAERRPDEALRWYDHPAHGRSPHGRYAGDRLPLELADAVEKSHPHRAIQIWQQTAEAHIDTVQAQGYHAAAPYLHKIRKAFAAAGQTEGWQRYLAVLRERNRRRPRCLEMLDGIERGPRRILRG